jgi:DNA invertase Pin-like site-specific DNA recombinase
MKQSAILYARFSSMEQAKGLSLDRQLSEGRHYIEAKGWQLEQELVDKGRSAFSGANRAVGSELGKFEAEAREGLHAGKILVVENIDRLSRQGAKAAATFIWSLHEAGVSVATTQDSQFYNADSEENDLMEIFSIIIKAQLSHEESFKKAERAKFTWHTRHEKIKDGDKGTTAITPPAWIKAEGGRYVLNPERAKLLNEIYDLYIDGIGISKIVQMLNERREPVWAVRKRDGKGGWRENYIHRLLRKRAVLGEYVTVNGETLAADYFPQAISAEKFNRAQAELAAKSKTGGHAYKRMSNLLASLVVCSECGGNAAFENKGTNQIPHVKKNGERVIYNRKHYERLRCDNARRRNACTNKGLLDYKIVEGCVLDHLGALIGDPKSADAAQKANAEKIAELERQIAVKTKQIDNLLDALADGSKAVAERIVKYEAELEQLNELLTQAQLAAEIALSQPSPTAQLEVVEALRREINDSDEDKRFFARSKVNAALRRLIDKIMFSSDGNFLIYGNDAKIWLIFDKNGRLEKPVALEGAA